MNKLEQRAVKELKKESIYLLNHLYDYQKSFKEHGVDNLDYDDYQMLSGVRHHLYLLIGHLSSVEAEMRDEENE